MVNHSPRHGSMGQEVSETSGVFTSRLRGLSERASTLNVAAKCSVYRFLLSKQGYSRALSGPNERDGDVREYLEVALSQRQLVSVGSAPRILGSSL